MQTITAAPAEAYRAAMKQRDELSEQVSSLTEKRAEVAQELSQAPASAEAGLRSRLGELDLQILSAERNLADANERVAQLAGVPGAIVERPRPPVDHTDEIAAIALVGGMILLFPVVLAYARRLWKRAGTPVVPALPSDLGERMTRMEQALDAVAIEVERMSEAQRFLTKVVSEPARAIPGVGADPLVVPAHARAQRQDPG